MIDSQPYLERADHRLQALLTTIRHTAQANDGHEDARVRTIAAVMHALAAFAEPQIGFFTHGFDKTTAAQPGVWLRGFLDEPTNCAVDYVIGTMLEQVAADLGVYTQALSQRIAATAAPGYAATLTLADQLATLALQRAAVLNTADLIGLGIPGTPITYLQKSPQVRIIPYAPAALVGVPFTAIGNPYDLLGIPHEIGHYVFKRYTMVSKVVAATSGSAALSAKVQGWTAGTKWAANWIEEIFADAFGFLIAGPAAGITLQERILLRPSATWTVDDGVYPIDAIRGYIATDCLRIMAANVTATLQAPLLAAARFLEERWRNRLTTLGIGDDFTSFVEHAQTGQLQDARAEVITVLERIYQDLAPLLAAEDGNDAMLWSTGLLDAEQADAEGVLLQQVEQFVTTALDSQLAAPALQVTADQQALQLSGSVSAAGPFALGETRTPFDAIRDAALTAGVVQAIAGFQNWCSFTVRVMRQWGLHGRGAGHTHGVSI